MDQPITHSVENAKVESLQKRCLIICVFLIMINTMVSIMLMWNLFNLMPVGYFLGLLCLSYVAGMVVSVRVPFAQMKSFITILIIASVIIIAPLAVVSHIFGTTGNYLWIAAAPMACIVIFPDLRPGRIIIFLCSAIFLIVMLMMATNYLKPFFYVQLQGWYSLSVNHANLKLSTRVAMVQPTVAASIVIFIMLYYIHRIAEMRISCAYEAGLSANEVKDSSKYGQIFADIEEYFNEAHPYLDPGFTITQLAQYIGSNTVYASKAISMQTGLNFSAYVNRYRVRNAKEMIREIGANYTLEYIYTSSGFKNQSTFNRVFKQIEGVTPTEWIN